MAIETRTLGRTGLEVTTLGYGAMELRGAPRGPEVTDERASTLLNAVLDGGITLIDTSPDYGRSEDLIGRYAAHRREEFFLASKCGCPMSPATDAPPPYPHDYSPANIRANVERSLTRLRTDRLDLLQVHMSPSVATMAGSDVLETLQELQDEGKARFIGMSGIIPELAGHIELDVFDVFQIPYSVVQREHEDLITAAAQAGAGILIRGGAARGAPAADKNWRTGPLGVPAGEGQRRWEAAGLDELLHDSGLSRIEFTLRFTLSNPSLSSTIVGTSSLEHMAANLAIAAKGPLPADVYAQARKRLDA
jgi:aryl-alcohol dehydrogenase-like predicted oxidoreductase